MPKKKPKIILQPKKILHVYCEGEKTEPNYFKAYIAFKFPGDQGRKVVTVEKTKKNTPVELVNVAVAAKDAIENLQGDEFWVVYDREAKAKYPDELHAKARRKAQDNGVNVALSNVCFELWLLLHCQDCTAPYNSCDDLLARSPLKEKLKEIGIDNYEKSEATISLKLVRNHEQARIKAARMNQNSLTSAAANIHQPHLLNPYTEVHLLLDAMDNFKA